MGMFAELVIAFTFRPDVPSEVLSAFRSVADEADRAAIEPLQIADDDDFDPTNPDDEVGVPWLHDWGELLRLEMSFTEPGEARANLRRAHNHWHLTSRCNWKTDADSMVEAISWLAPYCCPNASEDHPDFLGYIRHEDDDRPILLIWHDGADFRFEVLGPPSGMYA